MGKRRTVPGHRATFDSVGELARVAIPFVDDGTYDYTSAKWAGFESTEQLRTLAVDGWGEEATAALDIARSVVETVHKEHNMPSFRAVWDTSGCEVDVARYLSRVPENMIDYEMVHVPRTGRVVTLVASTSVSGAVGPDSIKRRGYAVAALAFALSEIGLTTELWIDSTTDDSGTIADSTRVLVKGPNDELDPARIMFAYAHPALQRGLMLSSRHAWPADARERNHVGGYYGSPADPIHDMPEGTIYLPCVLSDEDVPDAYRFVTDHLRQLGLLGEE